MEGRMIAGFVCGLLPWRHICVHGSWRHQIDILWRPFAKLPHFVFWTHLSNSPFTPNKKSMISIGKSIADPDPVYTGSEARSNPGFWCKRGIRKKKLRWTFRTWQNFSVLFSESPCESAAKLQLFTPSVYRDETFWLFCNKMSVPRIVKSAAVIERNLHHKSRLYSVALWRPLVQW